MTTFDAASLPRRLAPHGALRAAINLSNTLLVSGRDALGAPVGLSPSVASALAQRLEVPVALTAFAKPAEIVDKANSDVWDVALLGAEHARPGSLAFTPPYALIEATYLVRAESTAGVAQMDVEGVRIGAPARTAYGLWLERNLVHATLVLADGLDAARDLFARGEVDALAGLRPWLLVDSETFEGSVVLSEAFTAVAQAIGYRVLDADVAAFLHAFVEDAKRSGLIARLMSEIGVNGVTVAPSA